MNFTIHFPHWLTYVGCFLGGCVVGGWLAARWIEGQIINGVGRAFGW